MWLSTCRKLFKNIYIDGALKKIIEHLLAIMIFNETLQVVQDSSSVMRGLKQ